MEIPALNETYKNKEYWNERFTSEKSYEWLETFDTLKQHLTSLVQTEHSVLLIGCGNSNLSSDMYDAGYHNITSLDYSKVIIDSLQTIHSSKRPEMQWVCADMRELEQTFPKQAKPDNGFDVVIDKAGMDALMTDSTNQWEPNPETIENCHQVCKGVSSVLKDGGYFIQITFAQPHFHVRYLEGGGNFKVNFGVKDIVSEEYQWKGTVTELKHKLKFSNYLWIMQKACN